MPISRRTADREGMMIEFEGLYGFGCMRLSTADIRDENSAIATLHAAFDGGVTLLDTASAYCHNEDDRGHNERLIAAALASWAGDATRVLVATKGGMDRPGGRWVPNGRAKALAESCEASLKALGRDAIGLYQLHTPDPRVPIATSARVLAKLRDEGLVREVGLGNVTLAQLKEAQQFVEVAAVQVELSFLSDAPLRNGLAAYCREHEILLIAHSPLGGPARYKRLAKQPALRRVGEAHGLGPEDAALAWLTDLGPGVVPIPGATRVETAARAASSQQLELTAGDRVRLDAAQAAGRRWRTPKEARRPAKEAAREVVMIMGYPGAGKSTAARSWVERGYERLNRDTLGGTLAGLAKTLGERLAEGGENFVMDNTYGTRLSRNEVIETAWEHSANVRCIWIDASLEDAQINAVGRMLGKHGRLLDPDDMTAAGKQDPNTFPPKAQFDYRRTFEPPELDEGFESVERVEFSRTEGTGTARALILEYDGVLRRSVSGEERPSGPGDVDLLPGRREVLQRFRDDGWLLLGTSWQPEVEGGSVTRGEVEAAFERTHQLLGLEIDVAYCSHQAGPPRCWCRKPLPGLGVLHARNHDLDPSASIFVGRNPTDKLFAARLGFQYADADDFFGESPT